LDDAFLVHVGAAVTAVTKVVVVGAGQAGGEVAAALRAGGHRGAITVLGEEAFLPYTRPPLSKAYLLGGIDQDELLIRATSMYAEHDIDVRTNTRVSSIDRRDKRVTLDGSGSLDYGTLVLATGGRARRLPVEGLNQANNVFYVRTINDVDALRRGFVAGARLLVIGGGYIGLEIGSVARRSGLEVTIVEAQPRVLARVAAPATSTFFERIHREEGVGIVTGVGIDEYAFDDHGDVTAVLLSDGTTVPVDLVLVGIGLVPNVELAEEAGLEVDDGIVVDHHLRTTDPAIYAIGDVARFPLRGGGYRRLESTPNAADQARLVAEAILGRPAPYETVPWFWSDQFDVKLQVTGISPDCTDVVVRGDPDRGRALTVFYLHEGIVEAADVASSPRDFAQAKKLVAGRAMVPPIELADTSIELRDLVTKYVANLNGFGGDGCPR
jgi:3-phenylpropionate/trans-cinnamate dioxygenase ferredoxin reductase subunit